MVTKIWLDELNYMEEKMQEMQEFVHYRPATSDNSHPGIFRGVVKVTNDRCFVDCPVCKSTYERGAMLTDPIIELPPEALCVVYGHQVHQDNHELKAFCTRCGAQV